MLTINYQGQFKRDYKLALKRGLDPSELEKVVTLLASQEALPPQYKDHALVNSKKYKSMRECHIQPDWLLVYKVDQSRLILSLIRTGTYSDLF